MWWPTADIYFFSISFFAYFILLYSNFSVSYILVFFSHFCYFHFNFAESVFLSFRNYFFSFHFVYFETKPNKNHVTENKP